MLFVVASGKIFHLFQFMPNLSLLYQMIAKIKSIKAFYKQILKLLFLNLIFIREAIRLKSFKKTF